MKELLTEIIYSVLKGKDYRTFVLATINERFVEKVQELIKDIFAYKKIGGDWLDRLLEDTKKNIGKENKFKLLWFGGINDKTVKNMFGESTKEVCLEVGKKNINALKILLKDFNHLDYSIKIAIRYKTETVELDEVESIIFINTISAMRLTIQGGAWSEVGKQTEKSLLYTIFKLLKIPEESYLLIFNQMKKGGFVENREIDAIVFNKKRELITIELKLLGIGNPEIGDEALARKVGLFLIDQLSEMMTKEATNKGIQVIEFRKGDALDRLYEFFNSKEVECTRPNIMSDKELKRRIASFVNEWDEEKEGLKVLKKLKDLSK